MIARVVSEVRAFTPPIATTGVGVGLVLSHVQTIVGIAAGIAGIIATLYTVYLRHVEHQRRMRELDDQ